MTTLTLLLLFFVLLQGWRLYGDFFRHLRRSFHKDRPHIRITRMPPRDKKTNPRKKKKNKHQDGEYIDYEEVNERPTN